ncbi:MAG: Flp pilus assembly protein CpaB [bacterium]|nr:Flp pilus assembly protein CpaB [bacterium]
MNPVRIPRIVIAAGLGLASSAGMTWWFSRVQASEAAPEATRPVVVALRTVAPNEPIGPRDLTLQDRPERFTPAGATDSIEGLIGRSGRIALVPGEPVLEEHLWPRGQRERAILPVPPGMRAVTVAVDEVVGVAGFVQPGMVVDVVSTMDVEGETTTHFLLQRVRVLACAQEADRASGEGARVVSSATLAVTPADTERLILAADRGKIRLAMRSNAESSTARTSGVTPDTLLGVPRRAPDSGPAQRVVRVPVRVPVTVRVVERPSAPRGILVIRGTQTEEVNR